MGKRSALRYLRDEMALIYPDSGAIRRIVDDVGLDGRRIGFDGAANNVWQNVLIQAESNAKLREIVDVAAQEFPRRAEQLETAYQKYLTAPQDPISVRIWFISGLLAMGVMSVLVLLWQYLTWIEPMSPNHFNLAVARIPVVDEDSHQIRDCLSDILSNEIYLNAVEQPNQLDTAVITGQRSPQEIGRVYAQDYQVRQSKAANLADRINATVFVGGVITKTEDSYILQPEFYIGAGEGPFDYASEINGSSRFGTPIELRLPPGLECEDLSAKQLRDINRPLDSRITALRYMIWGLRDLYGEKYAVAHSRFEQMAEALISAEESSGQINSEESQGAEVAYLLQGAAKLRVYDPAGDPMVAAQALQDAWSAFEMALEHDDNYSRALLGLASVALESARTYDHAGIGIVDVDETGLKDASELYESSLRVSDQPSQAYIPEKATLGLGLTQLTGFEHDLADWSGQLAYDYFSRVASAYEHDRSSLLAPVAAQAYGYMGRLEGHNRNWETMEHHIDQAIRILEQPKVRPDRRSLAVLWSWVAFSREKQGNLCGAVDGYLQAIEYGQGMIGENQINSWKVEIERIDALMHRKGVSCA